MLSKHRNTLFHNAELETYNILLFRVIHFEPCFHGYICKHTISLKIFINYFLRHKCAILQQKCKKKFIQLVNNILCVNFSIHLKCKYWCSTLNTKTKNIKMEFVPILDQSDTRVIFHWNHSKENTNLQARHYFDII